MNYVRILNDILNESSTLSKMGLPKNFITSIHNNGIDFSKARYFTTDKVNPNRDFTNVYIFSRKYLQEIEKFNRKYKFNEVGEMLLKIVNKLKHKNGLSLLTDEEKEFLQKYIYDNDTLYNPKVKITSKYKKEEAKLLKPLYVYLKATSNATPQLPHDIKVVNPLEKFPELKEDSKRFKLEYDKYGFPFLKVKKTALFGAYRPDSYEDKKLPGILADISKHPWGNTRVLLAVPDKGRYDFVYYKGKAFDGRSVSGGKKYRVLTMDENGNLKRDWMAYQGLIMMDGEKRDDFATFPANDDGYIYVYFFDTEDSSATDKVIQRESNRIGYVKFLEIFKNRYLGILKNKLGDVQKLRDIDGTYVLFLEQIGKLLIKYNDKRVPVINVDADTFNIHNYKYVFSDEDYEYLVKLFDKRYVRMHSIHGVHIPVMTKFVEVFGLDTALKAFMYFILAYHATSLTHEINNNVYYIKMLNLLFGDALSTDNDDQIALDIEADDEDLDDIDNGEDLEGDLEDDYDL